MNDQNEKLTEKLTIELHDNLSKDNFKRCLELAHEDVHVVSYAMGMTFNGKDEFENFFIGFKQAFPDLKVEHWNIIASGNKVAVEFSATGIHTGPLHTPEGVIPPSGKKVTINVAEFLEWENGKLRKLTNYQDSFSLMKQIGA